MVSVIKRFRRARCRQGQEGGKHWGIVPVDPAFAQRCYDLGCRMITFGNDIVALKTGIAAIKQNYSSLFA
jgi:2-keto-3-deoxy-L-rhamnonate aldolase RhmA